MDFVNMQAAELDHDLEAVSNLVSTFMSGACEAAEEGYRLFRFEISLRGPVRLTMSHIHYASVIAAMDVRIVAIELVFFNRDIARFEIVLEDDASAVHAALVDAGVCPPGIRLEREFPDDELPADAGLPYPPHRWDSMN